MKKNKIKTLQQLIVEKVSKKKLGMRELSKSLKSYSEDEVRNAVWQLINDGVLKPDDNWNLVFGVAPMWP